MPKITLETCKAPSWSEFPKLTRIKADAVFAEAAEVKRQIRLLERKLKELSTKAQAKLEVGGLPDDVKSVLYDDLLITRKAGYTRRSLDTKWAVRKLVALRVSKKEIDDNTKEAVIEPSVSFQLLGDDDEGDGRK